MFKDTNLSANTPDFSPCLTGKQILQEPQYKQAWKVFREHIPLSDFDFEQYYTATLMSFAEYVQNIPATRHIFYAQPGGLFQLGFDRAVISTKLAIKAYHDFEGRTPDQLTSADQAELFAVFAAALMSDLGLLNLRFHIKTCTTPDFLKSYDPYQGSLSSQGKNFAYGFRNPEIIDWPAPGSLVIAQRLLSQTQKDYEDSAFAWISHYNDVLQLWYAMILELTPTTEGDTRRRFLISLLPLTDSELLQDFLLNIHENGMLSPVRHARSLFSPGEIDHEALRETAAPYDDAFDPVRRSTREFEKVFGGMGAADSTNAQVLGSLGAALDPQIRYGLAFLGWLITLARSGRLSASNGAQAFSLGGGQIAFDIQKLQQQFATEKNMPKVSTQELMKALKEAQISTGEKVRLGHLEVKTPTNTERVEALILPSKFLLGDKAPPLTTLGVTEINTNAPMSQAKLKNTLAASYNAIFQNKPTF